jgi:hypothetical protein
LSARGAGAFIDWHAICFFLLQRTTGISTHLGETKPGVCNKSNLRLNEGGM